MGVFYYVRMLIPWSKAVRGGEDSEAGAGRVYAAVNARKVGLQDSNPQLEL